MAARRSTNASLTRERVELSGLASGIEGFAAIGRRHYRSARRPVAPHLHPDWLEISFLARGQQMMQVGKRQWLVRAGQVMVIPAGEAHGSAGQPAEHCSLYWLNLDTHTAGGRFLGADGDETRELVQRLQERQGSAVAAPAWLRDAFDRAIELHSGHDPLRGARLQHELVRIVLGVIDAATGTCAVPDEAQTAAMAVRRVQEHIALHLSEPLHLDELSRVAGISTSRLFVQFKRDTALTPREYVLRQKVASSQRMLGDPGCSITRIAVELGFSSSQYYATVFRRFVGISPRAYRRRASGALG